MQTLYLENHQLMYRAALKHVHNVQDAEDVVNSTCEALIKHIRLLKGIAPPARAAYLLSTVQNQAILLLQRRSEESSAMAQLRHAQDATDAPDESEELISRCTLQQLEALLDRLAPEDRQALKLKCFDQLPDNEIALIMNISESTVRSRVFRARQRLHTLMKEVVADGP